MTGSNEFKLNQPPEDGISSVKFSPNTSQFLLVSSWDTSVRLYDVPANSMRLKYQHTGAVLDCAFYVGARCCRLCVRDPAPRAGRGSCADRSLRSPTLALRRVLGFGFGGAQTWELGLPFRGG